MYYHHLIFVFLFIAFTTDYIHANWNPTSLRVRNKRQNGPSSGSGSQRVNQQCNFNIDCISGAFCQNGVCACVTSSVHINSYCYPKVNPEQPGCTYEKQCNSVWPGATCVGNICKCPYNRPPQNTRDGPVCYAPGGCPTNDQWPKLRDSATNTETECSVLPLEPSTGDQDQIGCGLPIQNGEYLYDCITSLQSNQGYCCPTRAFACIQQLDQGTSANSGLTSTRYYFNSITQSCQEFSFIGAGGNANNFLSIAQCESYCKQDCRRGTPEYTGTNPSMNVNAKVKYCSEGSNNIATCGMNYQCQRSGSTELCCPTVAFVCSPYGGIPSLANPGTPYDQGYGIYGRSPVIRWYYDSSRKICNTFEYLGQIGNFNNFLSRQECEAFCAQAYCTRGEPLKDSSGFNAQICNGNGECPATHICETGVCCPSKYTVCNQPKLSGGVCNNYATRFWFNVHTGSCEQMLFTGCQGNANNFESFLECQQYCSQVQGEPRCPQGKALKDGGGNFYKCGGISASSSYVQCPVNYDCLYDGSVYGCCASRTHTCQVSFDPGRTCGPTSSSRWYFDNNEKSCKTFVYFGCDGNSNNFPTQRDCIDYCRADGCPDGGEPLQNTFNQPIMCGSSSPSSTCPTTHICTTISVGSISSGFLPSGTNPFVQNQFLNYCCPKKSTICSQNQDAGVNCGVTLQRYYYNKNTRVCSLFTYSGCSGNSNNFRDAISCQRYCDSSACQAGEQVYADTTTRIVQTCSPGSNQCPSGFNCVRDVLGNRYVCCGSPNTGMCPSGQKTYIDGFTGQARKCTVNVVGSCPNNYLCYYNPEQSQYFCCSAISSITTGTTNVCGSQQAYLIDGQPQQCSGGIGCHQGYTCNPGPALAGQIQIHYCCTASGTTGTSTSAGCPVGYTLLGNACNPYSLGSCPKGVCQYFAPTKRFQCCAQGTSDNTGIPTVCVGGNQPYREPSLQQVIACSPGASQNCPSLHQCERDAANRQYICCPTTGGTVTSTLCANNQQPYSINGVAQSCFINGFATCPAGFTCQTNPSNPSLGYCCMTSSYGIVTSSICPGSGQPLMISSGQAQTCNPYAPVPCSSNYFCVRSTSTLYYCCSTRFMNHRGDL